MDRLPGDTVCLLALVLAVLADPVVDVKTVPRTGRTALDSQSVETHTIQWGRQSVGSTSAGNNPQQDDENAPYSFDYSVRDPTTGDSKSQWESRVNGVVRGMYSLVQADGSLRSVSYTADNQNGFRALVKVDNPGLPQGPSSSSSGVPTSSVTTSIGAAPSSTPLFPRPPGPTPGPAPGPGSPPPSSNTPSGSSSAAHLSLVGPEGLEGVSQQDQATKGPPSPPAAFRTSPWKILDSLTSSRPSEQYSSHIGNLMEGLEESFPPQGQQPDWEPQDAVHMVDDMQQVQHPPIRLPLEAEGQHYLFAEPQDEMRHLMRRQRARKRHVRHHHHHQPSRLLLITKTV